LDRQTPKPFADFPLVMKPWQVTGAAWLAQREASSDLRSGILADDCGTGKSITCLSHILLAHKWARDSYSPDAENNFKPTFIVCPAAVLNVWLEEITNNFAHAFRPVLFYADARSNKSSRLTVLENDRQLCKFVEALDSGNPPCDRPHHIFNVVLEDAYRPSPTSGEDRQ
jgi:SNF2 family DNA or RNA helicase